MTSRARCAGPPSTRLTLPFVLLALLSGCSPESPSVTFTVRDSAGIQIVESSEPAWAEGEAWTVEPEPFLDLTTSGEGEAHEFFGVGDATILANGEIAVALATEIRFFSESGAHTGTLGRRGDGPGEFGQLSRIEPLAPDSFVAFDRWQRRATIYGPDREVVRVVRIEVDYMRSDRFAVLGSGFVLMTAWPSLGEPDPPKGMVRVPVPILAVSASGQITDTLSFAAGLETVLVRDGDAVIDFGTLFEKDSHFSVSENALVIGDAIEMEYRILNPEGTLERVVRAEYDLELDQASLQAERSAWLGDDPSPTRRRLVDQLPIPDRRPAYRSLQIDPVGSVWLEQDWGGHVHWESLDPSVWEVFDREGVWLGQVSFPGRFTVFEIGPDYVLGVRRDEFDVQHVQVLALHR